MKTNTYLYVKLTIKLNITSQKTIGSFKKLHAFYLCLCS